MTYSFSSLGHFITHNYFNDSLLHSTMPYWVAYYLNITIQFNSCYNSDKMVVCTLSLINILTMVRIKNLAMREYEYELTSLT